MPLIFMAGTAISAFWSLWQSSFVCFKDVGNHPDFGEIHHRHDFGRRLNIHAIANVEGFHYAVFGVERYPDIGFDVTRLIV